MHSNQMTSPYCHMKYRFKVKWSSQPFSIFLGSFFLPITTNIYIWFFPFLCCIIYVLRIEERMTLLKTVFNSLCLFLILSVPGSCSNDFFHTALIIKFIHFPGCTILLNKKLWAIIPIMLKVQRRRGQIYSF